MADVRLHHLGKGEIIRLKSGMQVGRYSEAIPLLDHLEGKMVLIYILQGSLYISYQGCSKEIIVGQNEITLLSVSFIKELRSQTELEYLTFGFDGSGEEIIQPQVITGDDDRYRNRWLAGYGNTPLQTGNMSLIHVAFPNQEQYNQIILRREIYHKHHQGEEYYLPLNGKYRIVVEGKRLEIDPFTVVEIPAGICHMWDDADFPVEGLNFRYPSIDDDKFQCSE